MRQLESDRWRAAWVVGLLTALVTSGCPEPVHPAQVDAGGRPDAAATSDANLAADAAGGTDTSSATDAATASDAVATGEDGPPLDATAPIDAHSALDSSAQLDASSTEDGSAGLDAGPAEDGSAGGDGVPASDAGSGDACRAARAGDLQLMEIMLNPGAGGAALDTNCDGTSSSADDEFIELQSQASACVSLAGLRLADGNSVEYDFPSDLVLQPGQVVLVFGGGSPTFQAVSGDPCSPLGNCVQVPAPANTLDLNNGGDIIYLEAVTSGSGTCAGGANDGLACQSITDCCTSVAGCPGTTCSAIEILDSIFFESADLSTGVSMVRVANGWAKHNSVATTGSTAPHSAGRRTDGTNYTCP